MEKLPYGAASLAERSQELDKKYPPEQARTFRGHENHVGGNHVGRFAFARTGRAGKLAQVHGLHH